MIQEVITDELIKAKIESITDRDRYGQRMIFDQRINALFPEQEEEVEIFCKEKSKMFSVSTYSNGRFQYKAITKKH